MIDTAHAPNLPTGLIEAAIALESHRPAEWLQFLKGLEEITDKAATALLDAPPEKFLAAQGGCLSLTLLMKGLLTARATAEARAKRKVIP